MIYDIFIDVFNDILYEWINDILLIDLMIFRIDSSIYSLI